MKTINRLIIFLAPFFLVSMAEGQKKSLSLKDAWASGKFIPKTFSQVNHLKDGSHFSRLKRDRQAGQQYILRYPYNSPEPKDTMFSTRALNGFEGPIQEYNFSASERYLLLKTKVRPIYRHSTRAVFYVYDRQQENLKPIHDGNHVMYTTISPNEENVAYVYENNLYTQNLESGDINRVTQDGKKNEILNGRSDWVYEEEFKLVKSFEWSPDGKKIAFYKFRQSDLKNYTLKKFIDSNYPLKYKYKYPKAGEANSGVSLHIHHLEKDKQVKVSKGSKSKEYYPRIKWTNDPDILAFQEMNRRQNQLNLYFTKAGSGESRKVLTKSSDTYVEVNDNLTFLKDNRFLWTSERDGYRHIYLFNEEGEKIKQLTEGEWVVTSFIGYDEKEKMVYYQSDEESPLERHVYGVSINGGNKKKLVEKGGSNSVNFSADYSHYIASYSGANDPPEATIYDEEGNVLRKPVTNEGIEKKMEKYNFTDKTFFQFKTRDNTPLNGWMIKPPDFDEDKTYPVFMTCYGGPGIQSVRKEWGWQYYTYYQFLAQQGYIVVTVDNRGTGGRGTELKKMTYQNLGHYESIDQIEAAKYLANKDYVDENRIGLFGWSYGGYLTLLSLAKGAEVFQTGVAVAPVTDWRFYDNIYTERYMRKPSENQEGYKNSSVLNYVDSFKDEFLLVHGMYDDNVHPQNSMEFMKKMIRKNKPFDSEFYPNKTHRISGGLTRYHLFNRITNYLNRHLKSIDNDDS